MRLNLVRWLLAVTLLAAGAGLLAAQGQQPAGAPPAPRPNAKFKITSSTYPESGQMPTDTTCAVPNAVSPAYAWADWPPLTVSMAAIFHDLNGLRDKGSVDETHWIFWNIIPPLASIPANVAPNASPGGIIQGKNGHGESSYLGPCPPAGAVAHHYVLELYALDTKVDLPAGSTRADLMKAMDGHVLARAAYFGFYGR